MTRPYMLRRSKPSTEWRSVSEVFIRRRKALGYSQRVLAEISGVSCGVIERFEARCLWPRIEHFFFLCTALGLKPSTLLKEAGL